MIWGYQTERNAVHCNHFIQEMKNKINVINISGNYHKPDQCPPRSASTKWSTEPPWTL